MGMTFNLDSSATAGTELVWTGSYNCGAPDNCPGNDSLTTTATVISGPAQRGQTNGFNLMKVEHTGNAMGEITTSDSAFSYIIMFQNTGTDTAYHMTIVDTLSPHLNIETISYPFSSKPFKMYLPGNNVVIWEFDNILLPDHGTDFQNSYGFLQYNILMKPNLSPGTIIEQRVAITYNYGDSYLTNTVTNTLALPCIHQDIPLNYGWNMISSYIQPDNADIDDIISEISSDIFLIKNGTGQTVIPSSGINQIGNWNVTEGYQVKTSASTNLIMGCEQIDPASTPVSLTAGWSIIPYLRNTAMNMATALTGIEDDIILVKDYAGDAYIPVFGINNIGDIEPGKGYKNKDE